MMNDIVLRTQNLTIGYDKRVVAERLSLELVQGELVCLLGPNGAGKSTLIRTLAGMQAALGGDILLMGDPVANTDARRLAQRLSVVLTERIDVGMLSGYGLVALGRHPYTDWTGALSKHDEKVIRWAVDAVGATDLAPRPVNTLSDGERQKLMIARALAQEPALMILDEPTAYLDLPRRVEIMQLLRSIARQTKRAILLSTHDLDLALRHADRIWLLASDGVMRVGAPEDLVLSGAFAEAFASEGVTFDTVTGSFKPTIESCVGVQVEGEGIQRTWLLRALERRGYMPTDDSPVTVRVVDGGYVIDYAGQAQRVDTVYAVVNALDGLFDTV